MNKSYRLDIQFLRAIAVLSVVLYHFQIPLLKGGFVGVDIFFVISGYLISKSIIKQVDAKNFSFRTFCFNRLKRLYPALIVTVALTYLAGYIYLAPVDFTSLSATTIYSTIGLSNIYFWLTSGYFDSFAAVKPLLHTWSLSVEFQFYLLWPLVLIILSVTTRYKALFLAILTIISGIIAYKYLKTDATGAFFLTPFRIHEFSIGALVYLLEDKKVFSKDKHNNVIYLVGLALTLYAIIFYDSSKIIFPGKRVWIPIIGAALMIYAGNFVTFTKILQNKFTSFIGEVSYSMYLVHWPIFVFYLYLNLGQLNALDILYLLGMTFIATVLLYYLVEKPFRHNKNNVSNVSYAYYCQSIAFIIILLSSSSFIGNGWGWRLPEDLRDLNNINLTKMQQFTWNQTEKLTTKKLFDQNGNKKILIIGDSQAADIINLLSYSEQNTHLDIVVKAIASDCNIPYLDPKIENQYYTQDNAMTINNPSVIPMCQKALSHVLENTNLFEEADAIFIAFNWWDFPTSYMEAALDKFNEFTKNNQKIILFGNKSLMQDSITIINSLPKESKDQISADIVNHYAYQFKGKNDRAIDQFLKSRQEEKFFDMYDLVCPDPICYAVTNDQKITYFDVQHLTPAGAEFLGKKFYELISKHI